MNIAITNGLLLTPPAFRAGLGVWSRSDGTSGSPTWNQAGNAALIPADQDFGACLEIVKQQTTTSLRFMGETPMIPGVYLRVSARVKLVAGAAAGVRIAGWAGDGARTGIGGLTPGPTARPTARLTARAPARLVLLRRGPLRRGPLRRAPG